MLAAPDFLTFIMNLKVYKIIVTYQMYITNDVASFMRVLVDHASPFLDAVHVVIGTGDVMGA